MSHKEAHKAQKEYDEAHIVPFVFLCGRQQIAASISQSLACL
jgi:hypothetical protein